MAKEALQVLVDEDMAANAERQGEVLRSELRRMGSPFVSIVRGKGLLNAIVLNERAAKDGVTGWGVCMQLAQLGLLAKPTHGNIIRFAPPLVINDEQMGESLSILEKVLLPVKH